jgi:light-regulated signal transduction histidine kinase (bacteriophytochrome)
MRRRYEGKLDGDADEFIGYITHAATRMSDLIGDLFSYSRLNDLEPQVLAHADPRAVVEFLMATSLRSFIEDTKAVIEFGELPPVKVDRTPLALVFENLIGNAIKYRGPEPPSIRIDGEVNGSEAWLSVRDNGMGIAEQYHKQIFGVFKRLHGLEREGTGMGLAVCKRIVERYRGRIWVESKEGEGSTFRFTLPAA